MQIDRPGGRNGRAPLHMTAPPSRGFFLECLVFYEWRDTVEKKRYR